MRRILTAAVVGGAIIFVWGALAHMATPLGMAGMSALPHEDVTIDALRGAVHESGLYFFPSEGATSRDPEVQKALLEKYRRGPTGMLLFHEGGEEPMTTKTLAVELLSDVLAALIAAILVSWMAAPYRVRALAVFLLAVFEFFSLSMGYWNWYGFPGAYIGAELLTEAVGWGLAGLAIARLVPPRGAIAAPGVRAPSIA